MILYNIIYNNILMRVSLYNEHKAIQDIVAILQVKTYKFRYVTLR